MLCWIKYNFVFLVLWYIDFHEILWIFNSFLDSFKSILEKLKRRVSIRWGTTDEAMRWGNLFGVIEIHEAVQTWFTANSCFVTSFGLLMLLVNKECNILYPLLVKFLLHSSWQLCLIFYTFHFQSSDISLTLRDDPCSPWMCHQTWPPATWLPLPSDVCIVTLCW